MSAPPEFRIEPLRQHDRAGFSCGETALDHYFRRQAGQDHRRHVATVFVAVEYGSDAVAGFYTLSATAIRLDGLPAVLARRLPRYPELPAILLGRLVVDTRWQGHGLGRLLIADALVRCAALTEIGVLFLVTDAKDAAAASFYHHLGFLPLTDQPLRQLFVLDDVHRADQGKE
ncbi:MAG: GNAT family N-acetyltransferase [Thermomicrobiales bacterium]|nr:GNAT family N-acetyltransferase [Thermomicrobiales bacterium]